MWSSILYLNRFPSSPTVVLDQVLSPDGKIVDTSGKQTPAGRSMPFRNHYVAFRGDLRHGVVANGAGEESAAASMKLRFDFAGQLLGQTSKSPQLPRLRWHGV